MWSSLLLALLGSLAVVQTSPLTRYPTGPWPDPEPCSGNCSSIHDPSIVHAPDGTWWLFSTGDTISIASAPALTGPWTYRQQMLPGGSKIHVSNNQSLWAPDVHYIGGTYYAYYCASYVGFQGSDIGIASASHPHGTWTDHGSLGIPLNSQYNKIDPNFWQQASGDTIYFSFGSAWHGIFQTTLSNSYLSIANGASEINQVYNSTYPPNATIPAIVEGSYQFAWTVDGCEYHYLFFSSGACCQPRNDLALPGDEYKIMVCRSESPSGPFFDAEGRSCLTDNGGSLVLGSHGKNVYAPGGQGVYMDSTLKAPVLYYHYVNPQIGYADDKFQFGFNYLDFSSGWPVVTT